MSYLIRDAPLGQLLRWATKNRILKYPEEMEGFNCPDSYKPGFPSSTQLETPISPTPALEPTEKEEVEEDLRSRTSTPEPKDELHRIPTARDDDGPHLEGIKSTKSHNSRQVRMLGQISLDREATRRDLEEALTAAFAGPLPSRPVIPEKLEDGTILVDWYTTVSCTLFVKNYTDS
jgi:MFS transporter, DHA1 family, multidrug resistance protein